MSTVVANDGLEGVPSLQSICDLYRSIVNDTFNNGTGQINTNASPWMKPFLNSAIRDLYSDLRIAGDMRVIKDNYLLLGIPPIAKQDPTVQVSLTYAGYFDGVTVNGQYRLPSDLMWLSKVWQRPSGLDAPFHPMHEVPDGLRGCYQQDCFTGYEMRGQNELWLNGALREVDMRLRYTAVFPDIVGDNIDFTTTYVPLQDSTNAIAFKMVAYYAQRLSPDQFSLAESQAQKFTNKLKAESIRNAQNKVYQSAPFGISPGNSWF